MEKSNTMEKILEKIKDCSGTYYRISLVENGKSETIILSNANGGQNSYSVAKAYTVAAIGMLYDKGLIHKHEKVCDIFRDELPDEMDPLWEEMTIHHLLTHRAGFNHGYLDIDEKDHSFITDGDYLKYLFKTKLEYMPGAEYRYSDAAFYMLSRIFSKKLGIKMDDYLWENLFLPLGFREMAWSKCPKGYPMGATGLYVYTNDLVKLGELYRNKGLYDGKRILSEEWIDITIRYGYEFHKTAGGGYCKGGAYGQMLVFYPEKNRSIAYHSYGGDDLVPFFDSLE